MAIDKLNMAELSSGINSLETWKELHEEMLTKIEFVKESLQENEGEAIEKTLSTLESFEGAIKERSRELKKKHNEVKKYKTKLDNTGVKPTNSGAYIFIENGENLRLKISNLVNDAIDKKTVSVNKANKSFIAFGLEVDERDALEDYIDSRNQVLLNMETYLEGKYSQIETTLNSALSEARKLEAMDDADFNFSLAHYNVVKKIIEIKINIEKAVVNVDDGYAKFEDGIDSIEEYNELLTLAQTDNRARVILNGHLISNSEAFENLQKIISAFENSEEWDGLTELDKAEWIFTLIAGAWYYNGGQGNEILWRQTINNDYYNIPDSIWNKYSIETVGLYHWIRDNANEEIHGAKLIDWAHYSATMATYIGQSSIIANLGGNFVFGGSTNELSGWLGDYKSDGDACGARDITSDYMALKTVQIYSEGDVSVEQAIREAYDSLNGQQIENWEEFEDKVIDEGMYTQAQWNEVTS